MVGPICLYRCHRLWLNATTAPNQPKSEKSHYGFNYLKNSCGDTLKTNFDYVQLVLLFGCRWTQPKRYNDSSFIENYHCGMENYIQVDNNNNLPTISLFHISLLDIISQQLFNDTPPWRRSDLISDSTPSI